MDMKKIFLTGSNGLLGSSILKYLSALENHEVISLPYQEILSIENAELHKILSDIDWIIHCAAQTNVEQCEKEPETCYINNCFLTEKIASCSSFNTKILYVSSTGVYGSQEIRPYHEYDKVNPSTTHHISKYLAEKIVLSKNQNNIIVRTGWLYGDLSKNDFVSMVIDEIKSSSCIIKSNSQQMGCPTYANDVAKICVELLQKAAFGVFNVVNSGTASRYDYVKRIVSKIDKTARVEPVESGFFTRSAQVSDNETAISLRMSMFGCETMRSWEQALDDFLGFVKSTSSDN
jgi:dTDP-4-dehydrorhamnose reductase